MKIIIIVIGYILIFAQSLFAYQIKGSATRPAKISFADTPIVFNYQPFILRDEIMAPAITFFEKIGATTTWSPDKKELTAYKNNTFIKIRNASSNIMVNGRSLKMPLHAMELKGVLYIPAKYISKILELDNGYDSTHSNLLLNFKETLNTYTYFGYASYKKYLFHKIGISLFIPEDFEKEGDIFYERQDEGTIQILATQNSEITSITQLEEYILSDLTNLGVKNLSHKVIRLGNTRFVSVSYDIKESHYESFYHINNKIIYQLIGTNIPVSTMQNIASTFSIDRITVNENLEHYVEYSLKDIIGLNIEQPIYSNMLAKDKIYISGYCGNAKSIHVFAEKSGKKLEFTIPIFNGRFGGNIYLPFGLGKHNISLYADLYDVDQTRTEVLPKLDDSRLILKLSVLNQNNKEIQYTIPTSLIDYDFDELYNLMTKLTFMSNSEYSRIIKLSEYIISEFEIIQREGIQTVKEIINSKSISALDQCMLYTALCRSAGIPSRVVIGTKMGVQEYWSDIYLNGSWFKMNFQTNTPEKYPLKYDSIEYLNM